MPEKHWFLKNCELFQHLSSEQIQQIELVSRKRSFPAGDPVYLPAESGDSVFLLAEGMVKLSHITCDGRESILGFVEPGELFGEMAVIDNGPRDEMVTAVKKSTVIMIPADEMNRLMADRADVALGLTKMVGLRRQRLERRLKNLLFLSNRERLIHLLLDLAEQFGVEEREGIRLRIRLSHQELASLIGSTRETITVTLGRLKAEGSVAGGRRKITLTQPQRLARFVNRAYPAIARTRPALAKPTPVVALGH